MDIRKLMTGYTPELASGTADVVGDIFQSSSGMLKTNVNNLVVVSPQQGEPTKHKIRTTLDMKFRVWTLHQDMNHTALSQIAYMIDNNKLRNAVCVIRVLLGKVGLYLRVHCRVLGRAS
jgi:hypothetical protein